MSRPEDYFDELPERIKKSLFRPTREQLDSMNAKQFMPCEGSLKGLTVHLAAVDEVAPKEELPETWKLLTGGPEAVKWHE